MKKIYEKPQAELYSFSSDDIITASSDQIIKIEEEFTFKADVY